MGFEIKESHPLFKYTQDDLENILKKLNRNLENVCEDINIIKEWIKTQKHLPIMPGDQEILIKLIWCKFSIEKTKTKIDMKYTMRSLLPHYFECLPSTDFVQKLCKTGYLTPMPNLQDGCRLHIAKITNPNEEILSSFNGLCVLMLYMEVVCLYDISESVDFIFDVSNLSTSLLNRQSIMDYKNGFSIFQKSFSGRLKSAHIVNLPPYAMYMVPIIMAVVPEKIRNRVIFHKSYDTLYDYFSKSNLPKDFGGELKSLAEFTEEIIDMVTAREDHFILLNKMKVDESLRPTPLKNDDILGYHGNFRKLTVD